MMTPIVRFTNDTTFRACYTPVRQNTWLADQTKFRDEPAYRAFTRSTVAEELTVKEEVELILRSIW
jgi:hypothetical protein